MTERRNGFTLVEILIASGVFVIIGVVVGSMYHFSYTSFTTTSWKQDAQNYLKLNNVFWQKYLSGATHKLTKLDIDAKGVILGNAEITSIPFKIKNKGVGNLLAAYTGGNDPWPLWSGQFHVKDDTTLSYQTLVIEAYLVGSFPDVRLYGKTSDLTGKVISNSLLLKNVSRIEASLRPYDEEYASSLRLVFTVQDPKRLENLADGIIEVRINTQIEEL